MKKPLLVILLLLILCLPVFAFSAVKLEQKYPEVSGAPSVTTIASRTSIPKLIQYYSTWAVIIAVLVVVISLIVAGIQYLTSTGRPEAMRQAKGRIFKSFLGLAILVGSYLVLVTVNPQLTILTIKYMPVRTGIVLFTKNGYQGFIDETPINELVDNNTAYFLHYDIPDGEEVFGDLVVTKWTGYNTLHPAGALNLTPERVNFGNFPLHAVGFWGELEQDTKIITYPQKNLEGLPGQPFIAYTHEGKLDEQGLPTRPLSRTENEMQIIVIDPQMAAITKIEDRLGFFKSSIEFFPVPIDDQQNLDTKETDTVIHPPLSIKIQRTGPGIYLYSEEKEERYLTGSHEDFSQENFDFDKKAEKIKIINGRKVKDETGQENYIPTNDYLAVLHEENLFAGALRIFFEARKDISETIPKYGSGGIPETDADNKFLYYPRVDELIVGNLGDVNADPKDKVNIGALTVGAQAVQDQYGAVEYVSSLSAFELSPDTSVCKEIRLYTEKNLRGNCISYSYKGAKTQEVPEIGVAKFPLPLYLPVNIPKKAEVVSEIKEDVDGNQIIETKEVDFEGEIRSILVRPTGACLVALFEHRTESDKYPGVHSELFTGIEPDLSDNEIGRCGSVSLNPRKWRHAPCASAIVVFPLEKTEEE